MIDEQDLCEHCRAFAVVYVKHRRCCEVRLLADSPPDAIKAEFAKVRRDYGDMASDVFADDVREEYRRITKTRKAAAKNRTPLRSTTPRRTR